MQNIKELFNYNNQVKSLASLIENLNQKFKVVYSETLFTPSWEVLETNHCPLCGYKLYQMRNKPLWYCKTNRHKSFIITNEKKDEVTYAIRETKRKKEEWEKKREMYRTQPYVYR